MRKIPHSPDDVAIAIVAIADTLNLKAIAKGGNCGTVRFFQSLQGYIFSPAAVDSPILRNQRYFLS